VDATLIPSVISGLKVAGDMAKGLLELKSITDVQSKVIDLQSAILSAQSSALAANADQFALAEEVRGLKAEIASMKAWEAEKQRYKLYSPYDGVVVYALTETMASGEPAHWICTSCYQQGKKSLLNLAGGSHGEKTTFDCPKCKSQVLTPFRGPVTMTFADE
jgi:hypothetical protein